MAGIPVIFGWGKKGKVIGYVGIDKCPNCKNYVHFSVYEYANNVNVYFISVAKFNRKNYLVCPVCDTAYELTGNLKEHYFEEMYNCMDSEITQDIFSKSLQIISNNFVEILEDENMEMEDKVAILINMCVDKINKKYHNKKYVDKVARIALKCLLDKDKAK